VPSPVSRRILGTTALAMICFAGNSLLCRVALRDTAIDAASFTAIRMASGAAALWAIVRWRDGVARIGGTWLSALALVGYAATFSYAYVALTAATGALILFGSVQAGMIGWGLARGERFSRVQLIGFVLALAGLAGLLAPGLTAPPLWASLLMIIAGLSWAVYSLRGRGAGDPTQVTAGNFMRTLPFAAALALATAPTLHVDAVGTGYAIASGALASGVGYAIWYTALKGLTATTAATVQLSVPAIAAAGGVVLLGEALTLRLVVASLAILGGIAIVITSSSR
jgi:drug/metabolite transporter (DMT)-like permease